MVSVTKYPGVEDENVNHWNRLLAFFGLAFGLSWIFWVPAALIGKPVIHFPYSLFLYAGGVGPALAALLLIRLASTTAQKQDYWRRIFEFRRIQPVWFAVLILIVPVLNGLGILLDWVTSGRLPLWEGQHYFADPGAFLTFLIFTFLFGPLPEELGWRGFGLDALQEHWNALSSSLILGGLWALWHLPLFFMPGTYQQKIGFGSLLFWSFIFSVLSSSVLYTWLYNNNNQSTLSAILFHFMQNLSGELMPLSASAHLYSLGLQILVVFILVRIWGSQRLVRAG